MQQGRFILKSVRLAGAACLLAVLTTGCAQPPMTPIPEAARRSISTASADVSGMKDSDTSKLGARGSDEGSRLGAQQAYAAVQRNTGGGSLLGLLVIGPIGAAIGSSRGSTEAQSVEVVDETRGNLRRAIQETDFTELLRQSLATSKAAGPVEISAVTAGAASAPGVTSAGMPVGHVIALEYRLNVYGEELVNPQIGVYVIVNAQVLSSDRKQLIPRATWVFCGDRDHFVRMGADNAAAFRAQMSQASAVLGEAIPYDLYVSRQPRMLKVKNVCMDFSDLPSRTGQRPVVLDSPRPIPLAPAATAPSPASTLPVAPTQVAAASSAGLDGIWQMELTQLTTTYGTTSGGECPARHVAPPLTFSNGSAEGTWGRLSLASDGAISGWMKVPGMATSMLPFIVNVSGHLENNVVKGTVSGRCIGSFVMRKQ
jgi:hypothetical protein